MKSNSKAITLIENKEQSQTQINFLTQFISMIRHFTFKQMQIFENNKINFQLIQVKAIILITQKRQTNHNPKEKEQEMLSINKFIVNSLIRQNKFSYYIHLKDHNKKINPEKNKVPLSFMNPRVVKSQVPQEKQYTFNLKRKTQKELERKMFEDYKEKVLKGQIDEDEVIEIDPLWGEGEKPKHYYQNLSKSQLMTVSHPQNAAFTSIVDSIHQSFFTTTLTEVPTAQQLKSLTPSGLVNAAVLARQQQVDDLSFWNNLEKTFGNKFYDLSTDELILLNYALKGTPKKGTPRVHSILSDLFWEDIESLSAKQLMALFYTFRNCKAEAVPIQDKILDQLEPFYSEMTFEQKANWLLTYTIARRPQTYKKAQNKTLHEGLRKAHQLIFNLNFSNCISKQLSSVEQCINLVFSLAKLRAQNTTFLTTQILTYLKQNIQSVTQNPTNCAKLLFYLQQVQGGKGVNDQQLFSKLIQTITQSDNFNSLQKIYQLRSIYAIWNYNLMTDDIFELYKAIQIEADSTILHYFCEIEMSRSSEREWEVLRNLAQLNHIPLPYYQSVKRFYNYMRVSAPDWDLTSIQQKLRNTQFTFDVKRGRDSFHKTRFYHGLMKYFKFSQQISPFQHTIPIDNLQLTQFANAAFQVSVDIVSESAFVPGTDNLKESYRNKLRSLENIGWRHVVLREKDMSKLPVSVQLTEVLSAFVPYIEEQTAVIQNRDYYRGETIEALRVQEYWDSMIAEEAEGYRNNPEQYAKRLAQIAEKEKKLSQQIAKVE